MKEIEKRINKKEEQEYKERVLNLDLVKTMPPKVKIKESGKDTVVYYVGDKLIGKFSGVPLEEEDKEKDMIKTQDIDAEVDMFAAPQTPEEAAVAIAVQGPACFKDFFPNLFPKEYSLLDPSGEKKDKFSLKSFPEEYNFDKLSPEFKRELSIVDQKCPISAGTLRSKQRVVKKNGLVIGTQLYHGVVILIFIKDEQKKFLVAKNVNTK